MVIERKVLNRFDKDRAILHYFEVAKKTIPICSHCQGCAV